MSSRTVRRLRDAEAVSRAGAEEVARCAEVALASRGRFRLVLSGGSTPRRLYEILAAPPFDRRLDWSRIDFFWGDERAVPSDHPESNYRMACEAWLAALAPAPSRVHPMEAGRVDLVAAARDYQEEIARSFESDPDGEPPVFDLVLLGLGPDAHTASLFPGTEALREGRAWVRANSVPQWGTQRLTLTAPILNQAAAVLFLVAGADKASALATVLEGPDDPHRHPAQCIHPEHGSVLWLVDQAAAAKLMECDDEEEGRVQTCP